jgi:hypothetical protein
MPTLADAISHLEAAATILRSMNAQDQGYPPVVIVSTYEEHPLGPAIANLSDKGRQVAAYVARQGGIVDYHEALPDLELAGVCYSSRGLGGILAGVTRNRWADLPPVLRLQPKGRDRWDIVMNPDYRKLDWSLVSSL